MFKSLKKKVQNVNKKPNNSLNGSTTNTEQTTSNPNMDLTQMSSSSLSSHLNRSHKIAEHDRNNNNNNNLNNELIPPAISSSSIKVTNDATHNLENLKHYIPVSSSSYIDKMPKEISTSSAKIVNSVANSFKLEIFDNANSDDDSDDYTKYNRVKFSPTTVITEPVTECETNDSSMSMKISSSNTNTNSNTSSKSISFSFKNKSNELLKKIQKRNTFASLAKPALTSCVDKDRELCEESNSDKCKSIVEAKLYKSKSAHVKKVSLEKSLTLKSINIDEEKTSSTSGQSHHLNRKSNINFIKVSPRVKSIAAFSTRNLFRNFETSSPNEKVNASSPISELNHMTTNSTSTNNSLLTPIETKTTDSMKIQNFKAKIYDNLMKSITNASMTNSLLKNEYKPRINNDEIKTISLKSSGITCGGLNKSETCKEIIKSKLISLSNEMKRDNSHSQPSIISDSNILNSKSVGQIPSKYSSFTDYNKNKISNKLNEIIATNNKAFISTTIPRDWKIMSNNCDLYDEEFFDYDSFSPMQPYEYAPKYLSFNYFTNTSDLNENSFGLLN